MLDLTTGSPAVGVPPSAKVTPKMSLAAFFGGGGASSKGGGGASKVSPPAKPMLERPALQGKQLPVMAVAAAAAAAGIKRKRDDEAVAEERLCIHLYAYFLKEAVGEHGRTSSEGRPDEDLP